MIDIDFFKKVNDNYGHNIGDKILKSLVKVLKLNIRKFDLVGRWGGEEFLIICLDNTINQTSSLCKKLQKLIRKIKVGNTSQHITVSFGIAQYKEDETIEKLLHRADQRAI
jgi:polar amino acid transport system substrate-binding protein